MYIVFVLKYILCLSVAAILCRVACVMRMRFQDQRYTTIRMPKTASRKSKIPRKSDLRKMLYFNLCVVRHGETLENRNNIHQGHIDTVLSDEGKKQAELVANRLQDEKFTHAFSSDLQRAVTTGECILSKNKHARDLVLVKDPQIREKSYGTFEGKSEKEIKALAQKNNFNAKTYVPEGGETIEQLAKRTVNFFNEMCKSLVQNVGGQSCNDESKNLETRVGEASSSTPVANVLISCHGGTIRQLFLHFARDVPSEFLSKGKDKIWKLCPNTGVSTFAVFVDKATGKAEFIRCTMIYDGSHLTTEEEKILHEEHAL